MEEKERVFELTAQCPRCTAIFTFWVKEIKGRLQVVADSSTQDGESHLKCGGRKIKILKKILIERSGDENNDIE